MPKTAPHITAAPTSVVRTRTVIGTHHQLAVLLGHAEASGRLITAGALRPAPGQPGHYLVTVRIREPQRPQLTGTTPTGKQAPSARRVRLWPQGQGFLIVFSIVMSGLLALLGYEIAQIVLLAGAHLIDLLGGVALLVVVGALVAAAIDRCPTCGR
jgi:hypothetical protein